MAVTDSDSSSGILCTQYYVCTSSRYLGRCSAALDVQSRSRALKDPRPFSHWLWCVISRRGGCTNTSRKGLAGRNGEALLYSFVCVLFWPRLRGWMKRPRLFSSFLGWSQGVGRLTTFTTLIGTWLSWSWTRLIYLPQWVMCISRRLQNMHESPPGAYIVSTSTLYKAWCGVPKGLYITIPGEQDAYRGSGSTRSTDRNPILHSL